VSKSAHKGFLTVAETAAELELTESAVYKLITKKKLPAVRVSERNLRISRLALDAYRAKLNGQKPPEPVSGGPVDLDALLAQFEQETQASPEKWLAAWKADEIEDSAENMRLAMVALTLEARRTGHLDSQMVGAAGALSR
jgi:excisionase family DNA binding protein